MHYNVTLAIIKSKLRMIIHAWRAKYCARLRVGLSTSPFVYASGVLGCTLGIAIATPLPCHDRRCRCCRLGHRPRRRYSVDGDAVAAGVDADVDDGYVDGCRLALDRCACLIYDARFLWSVMMHFDVR